MRITHDLYAIETDFLLLITSCMVHFLYKQRNHSSCKLLDICDLVNHRHLKYTLEKMSEEHEVSISKLYDIKRFDLRF